MSEAVLTYPLARCGLDRARRMMLSAADAFDNQSRVLTGQDIASIAAALNQIGTQPGVPSTAVLVEGTHTEFDFSAGNIHPGGTLPLETQQVVVLYQLRGGELYTGSRPRLVALIYIPRAFEVPGKRESGFVDYDGHRPSARIDRDTVTYNAAMMNLMVDYASCFAERWLPFKEEAWRQLYNLNPPYQRSPTRDGDSPPTEWIPGQSRIGAGGIAVIAALAVKKGLYLRFPGSPRGPGLPIELYGAPEVGVVAPDLWFSTWELFLAWEMRRIGSYFDQIGYP